jgi:hypothetical protein
MELADIIQGGGLVIGGAALAKLIDAGLKVWSARNQKVEIKPNPMGVKLEDAFVTRDEFKEHVKRNDLEHKAMVDDRERNYEALYTRMLANDKMTSKLDGILTAILADVQEIKRFMMGGRK